MTSSIVTEATSFTSNASHLLQAQKLATCAALSGHFSMENSVDIAIVPTADWTFTVSCQMTNGHFGIPDADPDALVIDLLITDVPVERLQHAVEAEIARARAVLERVFE